MAKVQLLQRFRLAPARRRIFIPPPVLTPIAAVQDADRAQPELSARARARLASWPEFVREIGRFAYLWAWPMVNVYNRYTSFRRIWRPILIGGIAPVAPINHLAMLHDYIGPRQRYITCPARTSSTASAFSILAASRWWSRCPISASATGSIRRPISGPTASPTRRHVRHQARLLSPGRPRLEGQGPETSRRRSAAPPISAPSSRACSRRTTRPTTPRCSRCSARSWPIRCRSSTAR